MIRLLLGLSAVLMIHFSISAQKMSYSRAQWMSGETFAYLSDESGTNQLYIRDLSTGQSTQVTEGTFPINMYQASNHGARFLYRTVEGVFFAEHLNGKTTVKQLTQGTWNYFLFTDKGKAVTFLNKGLDESGIYYSDLENWDPQLISPHDEGERNFGWNSSEDTLAFGSSGGDGTWQISIISRDRAYIQQLTHMDISSIDPVWSPDNERIAFISNRGGTNEHFDVYTIKPDGTDLKRVSFMDKYNLPLWVPGSKKMIISSREAGYWQTYITNDELEVTQKLTDGVYNSISADGINFLFQRYENEATMIYSMNLKSFEIKKMF